MTSFEANIFSTLVGVGIAIAYSSSTVFLICWIPGAILLQSYFNMFTEKTGCLADFSKKKIVSFIAFLTIGPLGLFLGNLLLPWSHFHSTLYRGQAVAPNYFLIIPVALALLLLGFMITLIVEGAVVARAVPQKQRDVFPAVVRMNLFSYIILLLAVGFKVWGIIFKT